MHQTDFFSEVFWLNSHVVKEIRGKFVEPFVLPIPRVF